MDKYGQMSKIGMLTVVLTAVVFIGSSAASWIIDYESTGYGWIAYVIYFAILSYSLLGLWFCPLEVSVDSSSIVINYIMRKKSVTLSSISRVNVYSGSKYFLPLLGSYGYFGWWGIYRNSELGRFKMHASNLDELFELTLDDGSKHLVSCSDAVAMVDQIEKCRKGVLRP